MGFKSCHSTLSCSVMSFCLLLQLSQKGARQITLREKSHFVSVLFIVNLSLNTVSLNPQVMVEAYRRDASSKDQLISELKSTKKRLLAEVKDLKQELLSVQGEKQKAELEQARLQKEVVRVQEQMNNMEAHLQAIQQERDQLETQMQVL